MTLRRYLALLGCACVLAGIILIVGSWTHPGEGVAPTVISETFDFGQRRGGEQVEHEFFIRNDSDTPMQVVRVSSSCSCMVPTPPSSIAPRSSAPVHVVMDLPNADQAAGAVVEVVTDRGHVFQYRLNGTVICSIPTEIDLGRVLTGLAATTEVPLRALGRPFDVETVTSGSDSLEAKLAKKPDGDWSLTVLLRPLSSERSGLIEESLRLTVRDPVERVVDIRVKGQIVPPVEVHPSQLLLVRSGEESQSQLVLESQYVPLTELVSVHSSRPDILVVNGGNNRNAGGRVVVIVTLRKDSGSGVMNERVSIRVRDSEGAEYDVVVPVYALPRQDA